MYVIVNLQIDVWDHNFGGVAVDVAGATGTNKENKTKQKTPNLRNDFETFVWWLQMSFWSPHSLVSYTRLAHGVNNGDGETGVSKLVP